MKTIQHEQPRKTPSLFTAEERYIMSCYGLVSDMPKCHPATNNAGQILHVTASELAKLQDQEKDAGWRFVVKYNAEVSDAARHGVDYIKP